MTERNFKFYAPVSFFEKADEPEERRRRIAGLITSERRDREGEVILQRGLNFAEFMDHGFFNENHAKDADGVLGEPDFVKFFRKGDKLPDGRPAPSDCHWSEGFLYKDDPRAERIWQKGLSMQKAGGRRQLGFSIEGVIRERAGADGRRIAKADVRHVAVTHCPVNPDTYLHALEKALDVEDAEDAEKTSDQEQLGETTGKALTAAGGGTILSPQSLEHGKPRKQLTKSEAADRILAKYPNISRATAERAVNVILAAHNQGIL